MTGSQPLEDGRPETAAFTSSTTRLRLFFLVPIAAVIAAVIAALIAVVYGHQRQEIELQVAQTRTAVSNLYWDDINHDANTLGAVMTMLSRDAALRAALARGDRAELLRQTAPLFAELRAKFGITHLYFSAPDRVNLLRVHQPGRHGDVIDRFTTLEAARTGTPAYGPELGPLGTFTLRFVSPWYTEGENRRLIGFVELGIEVDHILQEVQGLLNVQLFALISKEFLERNAWESGMRMLGRNPQWNTFPDTVLSIQGRQGFPPAVSDKFAKGISGQPNTIETDEGSAAYRAAFIPLLDARGRAVGQMVALIDVSRLTENSHESVMVVAGTGLAAGALLFILFYWLAGRLGEKLDQDARTLRDLASHDGLTGLYNHKTFYSLLAEELARAQRYHTPVSLLMLDLDRFKRVNDEYGHLAGDQVLRQTSELIGHVARSVDAVCRYGGEEIAVILPETDVEDAAYVAERMRASVENHPFDVGGGQTLRITVSIGIAARDSVLDSAQALVAAADKALYAAKEQGRNRVCRFTP